jgi:hypothetical protein
VIRFQRETSFLSERHDEIAVQPRPDYPDSGIRVEHPRDLFKETITLTPEHGPLAELLCNGKPSLDLTGQEFWDLLLGYAFQPGLRTCPRRHSLINWCSTQRVEHYLLIKAATRRATQGTCQSQT